MLDVAYCLVCVVVAFSSCCVVCVNLCCLVLYCVSNGVCVCCVSLASTDFCVGVYVV